MIKKTSLNRGVEAFKTAAKRCWHELRWIITQPGRHDLYMAMFVTALFTTPLWAQPVAAQVGVSEAEQVLCNGSTGFNIAQIITVGLGMISMYFILKFLLRMMTGLDKAGSTDSSAQQQGKQEAKGGVYSLLAALLPVLVPVFLNTAGINVASCLFP
ncbi:hypothetical protein [Halocatena marina]|uniref:Uncharacterized protein n=1 Tax=Halocatena marina TaxID=2934937 RepID=A0ABD5YS50_9EURY|nr:hypothetical protein [Halocatena marina]